MPSQEEILKSKSFCPNDKEPFFESCEGYFCHIMCSIKKSWDELEPDYQNYLLEKLRTKELILKR